jgi:hypothetical protein
MLAAGAALTREIVTRRVIFPQAISIRVVPVPSTNAASLPPVTERYVQFPGETGE